MSGTRIIIDQGPYKPGDQYSSVLPGTLGQIPMRLPNGLGLSVRNAMMTDWAASIEGAEEPVMQWINTPTIIIHTTWPGYLITASTTQISVLTMTRATLLMLVAKHVSNVMTRCMSLPCASKQCKYQIGGSNGLSVSKVYLNGIQNIVNDVWQVQLEAVI